MNIHNQQDFYDLLLQGVKALERIADAMEAAFPEAPDTEFDPNEGTIDFPSETSVEVESQTRRISELDIVEGDKYVAY